MVFVSLDDEFSLFETVLFPSVFQRYRDCLDGAGVLLLSGRVERDRGAHSITVRRVARIRDHTTP
jgi:DNA polymerase-3 subunit alpha/error-prone DNA polymerase